MNKNLIYILIILISLFVISLALTFFTKLNLLESLRIIYGSIYVLFLPGFIISYIFFPRKNKDKIDFLERFALSFALSIAIVPLFIFYLNLIGLKINLLNSFLTILSIIIISSLIIFFRNRTSKRKY